MPMALAFRPRGTQRSDDQHRGDPAGEVVLHAIAAEDLDVAVIHLLRARRSAAIVRRTWRSRAPSSPSVEGRARNVSAKFVGSGLGLAGAKDLIELHGGSISVTSVEGVGSRFVVRLPLKRPRRRKPLGEL
jgi:hypothetical protein